jgi:hypothetical protein
MVVTKSGMHWFAAFIIIAYSVSRYTLPIGAVDTHRPKPGNQQLQQSPISTGREYYADTI